MIWPISASSSRNADVLARFAGATAGDVDRECARDLTNLIGLIRRRALETEATAVSEQGHGAPAMLSNNPSRGASVNGSPG